MPDLRRFAAVVDQREQRDAFGVEQGGEPRHRLLDTTLRFPSSDQRPPAASAG